MKVKIMDHFVKWLRILLDSTVKAFSYSLALSEKFLVSGSRQVYGYFNRRFSIQNMMQMFISNVLLTVTLLVACIVTQSVPKGYLITNIVVNAILCAFGFWFQNLILRQPLLLTFIVHVLFNTSFLCLGSMLYYIRSFVFGFAMLGVYCNLSIVYFQDSLLSSCISWVASFIIILVSALGIDDSNRNVALEVSCLRS